MWTRVLALAALLLVASGCGEPAEPPRPTALSFTPPAPTPTETRVKEDEAFTMARQRMVESQIKARGVTDSDVLAVMRKVPRHLFVPPELLDQAYADHPLPIGEGQTISQPYIVALMTEYLKLKRGDKVLEIGTGSGYQAAILAELADRVYTVEIIPSLGKKAEGRLKSLGYTNVQVKVADGYYGWEEHAPYDAIVVTCAPDHVPPPLVQQLKDGGRMVVPVGPPGAYQTLKQVVKMGDNVVSYDLGGVVFVPMTGKH
ncbi:MAG: protein-L-isoaspartate(D-aspartate) O-methyltransferase [Chloroflexi bacterium]|nr:protein-L-isoaspartate(D-aspartate) O-methyltransferase [Chloroflexota bacterium]